jgi:hypothetical protein
MSYVEIVKIFTITASVIFSYGKVRGLFPYFTDPLMTKIGIYDLDVWSVIHYIYYGGFGYYYPNYFGFIMGGGIGWEIFEHLMGKQRPSWLGGFDDGNINIKNCPNWWYGRKSDILMNVFGFFTGYLL